MKKKLNKQSKQEPYNVKAILGRFEREKIQPTILQDLQYEVNEMKNKNKIEN